MLKYKTYIYDNSCKFSMYIPCCVGCVCQYYLHLILIKYHLFKQTTLTLQSQVVYELTYC